MLKMRLRQIAAERVVSLQKVPGLGYVEADGVGPAIRRPCDPQADRAVPGGEKEWPLLAEAIGSIVSVQTKAMGTAVGNLCVGTPASDVAPALCALGATVSIAGVDAAREIPIEEFFVDVGKTAVGPHEIVTEIHVPRTAGGSAGAFLKLSKTAEDIAKVNVAVMVTVAEGKCVDAQDRARFGGADPGAGLQGRASPQGLRL